MSDSDQKKVPIAGSMDGGEWDDSTSFAVEQVGLPHSRSIEAEMWGEEGYTFLTYRFPGQGLEQYTRSQIVDYLLSQGIQIDLEKFLAERMQLLQNFESPDVLELTITIAESDE